MLNCMLPLFLAEARVNVNHENKFGSPLSSLIQRRQKFLDGRHPFHSAESAESATNLNRSARDEMDSTLDVLLNDNRIDVDLVTDHFPSALHLAASLGDYDVFKKLLPKSRNINLPDRKGRTALCNACKSGHLSMVELLLERLADIDFINHQDQRGWTALIAACQAGHVIVVELLPQRKASIEIKTGDGKTALAAAVQYGHKAVVELLVAAKADVNYTHTFGRTAFVDIIGYAAFKGHPKIAVDIFKYMLQAGVHVDKQDGVD